MIINHIPFPKLLAAAQQLDLDKWLLGDALVAECRLNPKTGGPLGEDLKAVLAVITANGCELTAHELRQYYKVARAFPPGVRCMEISCACHLEARDQETLALILKSLGPAAD